MFFLAHTESHGLIGRWGFEEGTGFVAADTSGKLGTSMVRNLLRTVDFLPIFYLAGLICMLSNRRFQRLGDMAAGTLVISVPESAKPAVMKDIPPLAPATSLLRSEQSSIIDFLQRSQQLSEPRQQELASILVGITHQKTDNGVEKLQRIGAWFLGVR